VGILDQRIQCKIRAPVINSCRMPPALVGHRASMCPQWIFVGWLQAMGNI
jgi:hypothetical protein